MDRYQRIEKPRPETPINENEIRITTQGRMRNYITYATTLLQEKGSNEIVLKAMAELSTKLRIAGIHENTSIGSMDITDMWEPLEEGLLPLETTHHVSVITITLSKKELVTSSAGYQLPIPVDQVKPWNEYDYEGGCSYAELEGSPNMRGRGRGSQGRSRGRGRGNFFFFLICSSTTGNDNNGVVEYNGDGGWDGGRGYGARGWGWGRGRGFHGRGRGYGGGDMQQELGGYNGYGGSGPPLAQGREGVGVGAVGAVDVGVVGTLDQMDQSKQLPERL
ncbi:unnamed protein product [Camellia sinensis]